MGTLADRVGPVRRGCGVVGPSGTGRGGAGGGGSPTVPAEITVDPSNAATVEGLTANFTVTAIGTPLPSYQWQVNPGSGWVNATTGTGRTSASYTTAALTLGDDGNLYRCKVSNGDDDLSDFASLEVSAAVAAEVTVDPSNASEMVGDTATFTVTAIGTPAPTYQWEVDDDEGWVNVSTGTGGTTNSYTTAELTGDEDGYLYRCTVTNVAGSDSSASAELTVSTQQVAALFDNDTGYATIALGATLGGAGMTGFTLAGWFYFEEIEHEGRILIAIGQAGREAGIQTDSNIPPDTNVSFGDSNSGAQNDIWSPSTPPLNEWIFMTFRGPAAHPGAFTATWQAAAGGTIYTVTRANAMEDSIEIANVAINYAGYGVQMRTQYVRGYSSRLDDGVIDAERTKVDPTGAFFWNVFEDDGEGGLAVRDASGNARVAVLTNGTLSADGPAVGSVP